MPAKITRDVLEAFLDCSYKAHLRLAGRQGTQSDYDALCAESREALELKVLRTVGQRRADGAIEQNVSVTASVLARGADLILDAELEDDPLLIHFDGLKKVEGRSSLGDFHYVPVLFHEARQLRRAQRTMLEALALLLSRVQGRAPDRGLVYLGPDGRAATIRLTPGLAKGQGLLDSVTGARRGESVPNLLLNDHCHVCEFRGQCHAQAVQEDNLTLLRGLGEKEIKRYARKGLFTLTQLAHTFRPRRKGKRSDRRSNHRYHALHALAIRDRRVYVLGAPQVPAAGARIYLDVEALPDEGFVYLIGMIVCGAAGETRYSFWADGKDQEREIFKQFLAIVGRYDSPCVYCYGGYERAFLKRMRRQAKRKKPVDGVLGTLVNVLSIIYAHFYLPAYSNGLKAVAGCLGFSWTDEDAGGVQSIVWRKRWEQTGDETWRRKLLTYNQEDCDALRRVTDFLHLAAAGAAATPAAQPPAPPATGTPPSPPVVHVRELDRLANDRKWGKVHFVHANFEFVNDCAYFDYQRQRVFVRTSRTIRKHHRRPGLNRNLRIRPAARVTLCAKACPACGGAELAKVARGQCSDVARPRVKRALDLVITEGGMRRRVVECRAAVYRCARCGHAFVPDQYARLAKHYHGLMSWAMYEHVAHRVSTAVLEQKFWEFFGLAVASTEIHMFKGLMARYYRATYRRLLSRILAGPVLHVDETQVELKGGKGYVWVFTSVEEVVFVYKPTREGDFLREMLKDFHGVLVSDFYAAYDAIDCEQQKCLIHLIRDMNQELLANPFDEELQRITLPFSTLLKSVVATVDEHGLKRHHLRRHRLEIDEFYRTLAALPLKSEAALALRARLERNRDKLFTFIRHDGVPWNNNNAENAIKRFAYYRERTVGTLKESGLSDYLVLLSVYQSCRYKGVSFLKFLLSTERDIDAFCRRKRKPRRRTIELYPKGFIPPHFRTRKPAGTGKVPEDDRSDGKLTT